MSNKYKNFFTSDNTVSYVSSSVVRDSQQNRTCVFQAQLNTGDTVILQARISEELDFIDILEVTDENTIQEVVTAEEFRVSVTNTSGQAVICAIAN